MNCANEPLSGVLNHPFLQTQLVYDARPEIASISPYTRVLWDRQHRWISKDIARYKPCDRVRLLDVGCGPGHLADSQADHIETYVGVDPSMTELRRGRQSPSRYFVNGIGEMIDFLEPATFDIVTLVSVLDHCIDWRLTLDHCINALRPGGIMLVIMENSEQFPSRVRRWFGREIEHHDHMHFISLADLDSALGDRFETIKAHTYGYGFGLHSLTRNTPVQTWAFEALTPAMDAIGKLLMPQSGQALYGVYRKTRSGEASLNANPFCLPLIAGADGIFDGRANGRRR